mmetsp:Transcript_92262/g.164178  ORF Transcript_92262/g.164178 Transcript_92262/m.164178 type:complete len:136 (+) Transcript_92262:634-1041(+)
MRAPSSADSLQRSFEAKEVGLQACRKQAPRSLAFSQSSWHNKDFVHPLAPKRSQESGRQLLSGCNLVGNSLASQKILRPPESLHFEDLVLRSCACHAQLPTATLHLSAKTARHLPNSLDALCLARSRTLRKQLLA